MRLRIETVALGLVLAVVPYITLELSWLNGAGVGVEDRTGLIWLGCTTAALQAPTQVLLANGGHPTRAVVLMGAVTVAGSAMYGLLVLRRHLAHLGVARRRWTSTSTRSTRSDRTTSSPHAHGAPHDWSPCNHANR